MDRSSMQMLRLDKRLIRRRDWISQKDLEKELSALPDVSDKIAEVQIDDDEPIAEETPAE